MEPNKKDIQKWVRALRSGTYKQTRAGVLNNQFGYCCLGVACDIFIPKDKIVKTPDGLFIEGSLPRAQFSAPYWLQNIDSDFKDKTKPLDTRYSFGISLSELNDQEELSFDEIADLLELVYIERALDETI